MVSALSGNALSSKYVFVATAFYNILKQSISRYLIQGISQVGEACTSIKRIEKFLLNEEVATSEKTVNIRPENGLSKVNIEKSKVIAARISLENIQLQSSFQNLHIINLEIKSPQLVALTGPVGCGKSNFIKLILKELPTQNGKIDIVGKISYCSQEPWIFTGTIRENIVFNQIFDNKKYMQIIKICALENDLAILPLADQTIVSEKGTTLSGGQKARINLARSIYNDADIYLLDDPFSAVDINIGKFVFENCIKKYLKDKCVIFVTHQKQYLHDVSQILLLENGKINEQLDNTINEDEKDIIDENQKTISTKNNFNYQYSKKPIAATNELQEGQNTGTIKKSVYISYLTSGGSIFTTVFVFLLFVLTQVFASGSDYFIAHW